MTIQVISATGYGSTTLSAFDRALKNVGIFNYNLLTLSSIIPVGVKVVKKTKYLARADQYGHRLYVVKADVRSSQSDKVIVAGLGWYFLKNGSGVFVEHEIEAATKESAVEELNFKILSSLSDLCEFRGEKFHKDKAHTSLAVCEVGSHPACALAVAVYKSEPW
ncbi:hypothetical protein HYS82_03440 [Candidatus Amesbacteria bacterium]|nr:hypothetical protein [Candidatus Amesbacteria bacterium]